MKRNSISIFNDLLDDNFPFFQIKNDLFNLRTNIKELEKDYLFEINVAGLTKDNINIDIEDGYLVVTADEKKETEEENIYLRKEIVYKSCKRKYYIGNVKQEQIKATLNNGILSISVPKEDTNKNSKIEIK
mgnify:CR=1 FL=1